ncbi:MAG: LUD domain-containing protein [Clostridiales bacterium]|nr:LUD domain-containing protein [Clostridiales bacterium]
MFEDLKAILSRNGFIPYITSDKQEALNTVLNIIPRDKVAAFGGSETVKELSIAEALLDRGSAIYHRSYPNQGKTADDIMQKSMGADYYVTSANALTKTGLIVNTDGRGNRVAATIYGPQNIVYVIGRNKIVDNLDAAFERIRTVAAPLNCQRLGKDTPCVKGGSCEDCDPTNTICRSTVIHRFPNTGKSVYIVIVDEDLGY